MVRIFGGMNDIINVAGFILKTICDHGCRCFLNSSDFEFKSWPIAYKCTRLSLHAQKLAQAPADISISWLLGWLVCHTFGIRLIYPGLLIGSFIRLPLEVTIMAFISLIEIIRFIWQLHFFFA